MPHADGNGSMTGRGAGPGGECRREGGPRRGAGGCRREGGPRRGDGECRQEGGTGRGDEGCRQEGGTGRGDGECRREDGHADDGRREVQAAGEPQVTDEPLATTGADPGTVPQTATTIAVCAAGPSLSDLVDDRFGRAPYLHLVDPRTMTLRALPNDENRASAQSAGVAAAETVAEHRAQAVIVTKIGPKAADAFRRASIPVYRAAGMTVGEAAAAFTRGELSLLDPA